MKFLKFVASMYVRTLNAELQVSGLQNELGTVTFESFTQEVTETGDSPWRDKTNNFRCGAEVQPLMFDDDDELAENVFFFFLSLFSGIYTSQVCSDKSWSDMFLLSAYRSVAAVI